MLGPQHRDTRQRELMASGTRPFREAACKPGLAAWGTSPASASFSSSLSVFPDALRVLPAPQPEPCPQLHTLQRPKENRSPAVPRVFPQASGISAKAKKIAPSSFLRVTPLDLQAVVLDFFKGHFQLFFFINAYAWRILQVHVHKKLPREEEKTHCQIENHLGFEVYL